MNNIMKGVKYVIVNWDGVCVSSLHARHLAYLKTFQELGQKNRIWREEDTRAQSGRNPDKIWADTSLWGEKGKQAKEIFYQAYASLAPSETKLNDNIHAFFTLFKVREPNTPIIAFGAKTQSLMQTEIDWLVAPNVFQGVYGSKTGCSQNKDKDSTVALEKIITDYNITDRKSVLYLGYKETDRKLAENVGISYQTGASFVSDYLNQKLGLPIVLASHPFYSPEQRIKN